jgi:hypothetical protein
MGEIPSERPLASRAPEPVTGRVIADTTKIDPEHTWGDEGPVNA